MSNSEMQRSERQGYIMTIIKNCLSFLNQQDVGILKLLSITKLENILNH